MRLRLGVPSVTLGGLLKHLAWVEELYFQDLLSGRNPMAPFEQLDIERDRGDWPWNTASDDAPDDLRALWLDTVHQSRDALTGASVPRRDGAEDPRRHVTPRHPRRSCRTIGVGASRRRWSRRGYLTAEPRQVPGRLPHLGVPTWLGVASFPLRGAGRLIRGGVLL
jgi:hypothetical protein